MTNDVSLAIAVSHKYNNSTNNGWKNSIRSKRRHMHIQTHYTRKEEKTNKKVNEEESSIQLEFPLMMMGEIRVREYPLMEGIIMQFAW